MTVNGTVFDVALTRFTGGPGKGAIQVALPAALARALAAKGYTRARILLTDDGILLQPYVPSAADTGRKGVVVELPDW